MKTSYVEGWKTRPKVCLVRSGCHSGQPGEMGPVGRFCLDSHVLSLLKRDGRSSSLVLALMYVMTKWLCLLLIFCEVAMSRGQEKANRKEIKW